MQGLRSNVRTLTSTVRTLLGPTPALILLLAQCSNTCQRCCWHTVRTHVHLRAEASKEIRAILSRFERFLTLSWQKLAPKTSPTCSNSVLTPLGPGVRTLCANTCLRVLLERSNTPLEQCWHTVCQHRSNVRTKTLAAVSPK